MKRVAAIRGAPPGGSPWLFVALAALAVQFEAIPAPARAVATAYPTRNGQVTNSGMVAVSLVDHDARRVRVIASLSMDGSGADLAVLAPTPDRPTIEPAPPAIWGELEAMTRTQVSIRSEDGSPLACSRDVYDVGMPVYEPVSGLYWVRRASRLVTLKADTAFVGPNVLPLLVWLQEEGFGLQEEEARNLQAVMARGWWVTVLRPDGTEPLPGSGEWSAATAPLLLDYPGDSLELPVAVLQGAEHQVSLTLFTVEPHRMAWPRHARTEYANRLSPSEMTAIRRRHPNIAAYLDAGLFLTRLEIYTGGTDTTLTPVRAPDDSESRRGGDGYGVVPLESLLLLSAPAVAGRINRRKSRRERS